LLRARPAENEGVNGWRIFAGIGADLVLIFHAAYVAFVVLGLVAIIVGWTRGWRWVRNVWFRRLHLVSIGLVLAESVLGVACPLTVIENSLRLLAGEQGYPTDFVAYWMHQLIFYDWPPWVFFLLYAGFTALVAATYWLVPPEPRRRRGGEQARASRANDARLP
jgi:hypothetical protein